MTDRLSELGISACDDVEDVSLPDIPEHLKVLQQKESAILADIERLRKWGDLINKLPHSEDARNELDPILSEFKPVATKIRKELEGIKIENDRMNAETTAKGKGDLKTRDNIYNKLSKAFLDSLQYLNQSQTKHKEMYVEKVARTAKIAHPDITEQAIEQMIEQGNADNVFADQVLDKKKKEAAENLVAIQEQYRDLTRLHQSIAELHQMFIDMENTINQHGEIMDQLEMAINSSVQYSGEAVKHTDKAEFANKAGKRRCACCVGLGATAIGITGAGLAASLAACTIM